MCNGQILFLVTTTLLKFTKASSLKKRFDVNYVMTVKKDVLSLKEDYYLTPDKLWIPLRWIAPELLEEYRGSLIVTDQTKTSNVWYVFKS